LVKERTIIAGIAIPCLSILIALGYDAAVIALLSTIIGWYFGREAKR